MTVSEEFERFLELLGEKIKLKGWQKYRGGLDVKSKFAAQTARTLESFFMKALITFWSLKLLVCLVYKI